MNKNPKIKTKLNNKLILIGWGIALALITIELSAGIYGSVFLKTRNSKLFAHKKNEGQIRILCLGDSFTFGLDVSPAESYPAQLKQTLNRLEPQNKYIVFNQGIPGTNSSNLAYKFQNYIQQLDPDMIILLIGNADFGVFNDIDSRYKPKSLSIYHKLILEIKKKLRSDKKPPIASQVRKSTSSNKLNPNLKIQDLIFQGNELRNKQAYDQAVRYYEQAIELDAQNPNAQLELLRALKFAKRFPQAINKALNLLDSEQATLDIYIELANIFQIINNPWSFIDYAAAWQKNDSPKNAIIPNAKLIDQRCQQKLHVLIKKAYSLYTVKDYDQAFDCYQEIYKLFNNQSIFKKEFFLKCPKPIKHELLTICVYGIADALLLENLDYIATTAQAANSKLILLSYPEFLPPAITQIAQTHQIPLIDLRPVFAQDSNLLQASGHCTALGNQLIAEQISAYLEPELAD